MLHWLGGGGLGTRRKLVLHESGPHDVRHEDEHLLVPADSVGEDKVLQAGDGRLWQLVVLLDQTPPELVQQVSQQDGAELVEKLVEHVGHSVEGVVARRVHPLLVTAFVRVVLDNVENPE